MFLINKKYLIIVFLLAYQVASAQLYFFGRNKVQYEDFDWQLLKTEHFDIYYYGELKDLAEIGANYAEEAYEELKVKFNHLVVTKIPLIFYNTHIHFQQTNIMPGFIPEGVGGFFEFLKGRVVIPYLGNLEQFRHVIRHELVHVFMTSKVLNSLRDHRVPVDRLPPLWFIEGLAEYWSYYWDSQADMIMRDAVINNIFVPLSDINRIYGSFLMYKEGQDFLQFVSDTYGEDKILRIVENFWRFNTFNEVLEFSLEEKLETLDEKWAFSLKKRYFPLFANNEPHHIASRKLTNMGFNFSPRFYKGEKDSIKSIFYIGNLDGYTSVYKIPYITNFDEYIEPERIILGEKEAVFESFHLFKRSIDVSDSGNIAFVTKSGGTDAIHLYSIEEDEVIDHFQFEEVLTIEAPSFSHDGQSIVFSGNDKKGFSDLYIYNIADTSLRRITNDYYQDKDPIFSSNNEKIIFSSDRTGGLFKEKYNLFDIDLSSHKINYLTYVDANISVPNINKQGEIFFSCDLGGSNNIWKLNFDEMNLPISMTQKTRYVGGLFDFDFSADNRIVTSGFEKFSFQFYDYDLSHLPDSLQQKVHFDFFIQKDKWVANKLERDTEYQKLKYKREYSLDYIVSQVIADPVYGARGGAFLSLTDLMSDDRYLFLIYSSADFQSEFLKNLNVAISRINMKSRTNYAYGIFHYAGRRYDIRESDDYFYERSFGGFFTLIYPFSSFQRIEGNVTLANSDKEFDLIFSPRKSLLLSNTFSFVHDNSLWGPTGPMDGSRFRLLLGYTSDIRYSNENYYSVIADYRRYFRLSQRSALAIRGAILVNEGKNARRYFGGGSWDLRGWPRWSVRGEKMWLSSVELRFPFFDKIGVNFPFFGLNFSNIRGALYFDAGSAWDEKYVETLGSLGAGIRFNFFNAIVFRYDFGKKIEGDFTRFQPKWFWQFFFGWDF